MKLRHIVVLNNAASELNRRHTGVRNGTIVLQHLS